MTQKKRQIQTPVTTKGILVTAVALLIVMGVLARNAGKENVAESGGALSRDIAGQAHGGSELASRNYPFGRWRLAPWSALSKSRLWVSHILIRHRDVPPHAVCFSAIGWASQPAPPTRTRQQALALASTVRQRAGGEGVVFSELATDVSEDETTRQQGGSLGGVNAQFWIRWPEVLDALSALRSGEISKPVETAYGFHLFLLRNTPTSEKYSGARIVIGHDAAPWLKAVLAHRPVLARSLAEARGLAQSIYQSAPSAPESFSALVRQYSEHRDAERDGDFGSWSSNEQTPFPRAVEQLRHLEVGEVAPPIDTPFGLQIVQRTAERPRKVFGVQRLRLPPDLSDVPKEALSKGSKYQRLSELATQIAGVPERFNRHLAEMSSAGAGSWVEGKGSAIEEAVLRELCVGQVAPRPSNYGRNYVLLMRVKPPPGGAPATAVQLALASPSESCAFRCSCLRSGSARGSGGGTSRS